MSMVKIHVPLIRKTRNLNPGSFKRNFNGFKKLNLKKIKNGVGAVFAGRAETITSFIFYDVLAYATPWSVTLLSFHLQFVCPVVTAICFWNMDTIESRYSEPLAIFWYEFVTDLEVATLSQLPPINEAISRRRHSLWSRKAYGSGCSCPPIPTPTSPSHVTTGLGTVWHLAETSRSSAKMLSGASHHGHRTLLLMLGVLRRIGLHGGRYDPSTVKRRGEIYPDLFGSARISTVWFFQW